MVLQNIQFVRIVSLTLLLVLVICTWQGEKDTSWLIIPISFVLVSLLYELHLRIARKKAEGLKDVAKERETLEQIHFENLLLQRSRDLSRELNARIETEQRLREREKQLQSVIDSVSSAIVLIDPATFSICEANSSALALFEGTRESVLGLSCRDYVCSVHAKGPCLVHVKKGESITGECFLRTVDGKREKPVLKTAVSIEFGDRELILENITDVSRLKAREKALQDLVDARDVNIGLAKQLLSFVSPSPRKLMFLNENYILKCAQIARPCGVHGGDHLSLDTLHVIDAQKSESSTKTIVSLKDQSGHEVNCVLRSIATDMIQRKLLSNYEDLSSLVRGLDRQIQELELFKADQFFTGVFAELDHQSLVLRYLSCGHPSFFLVRDGLVYECPQSGAGRANFPISCIRWPDHSFVLDDITLEPGDQLLFYSDGLQDLRVAETGESMSVNECRAVLQSILSERGQCDIHDLLWQLVSRLAGLTTEEQWQDFNLKDDCMILGMELKNVPEGHVGSWYISSRAECSAVIENILADISVEWQGLGYEGFDRAQCIVGELVRNAWVHGNKEDPQKPISTSWYIGEEFVFSVEDQGDGFVVEKLPDPRHDERLVLDHGRGVFMVRMMADHVTFSKGGRRVEVACAPRDQSLNGV